MGEVNDAAAVAGRAGEPAGGRILLCCEGLSVRRDGREVISEVSLKLRAGEVVALLGPNGAGKSTLLEALVGTLPAAGGSIERRGRIAVALQTSELARRTAISNVMLALAWWGVPKSQREQRAREALRALGAEQLAQRQVAALSGGERRRVHLARVIAVAPDVLLLDEPFAGLDAGARGALLEDAATVLRAPGRATLVVVHDRAEAWAIADRLLIVLNGRLVAAATPRELLEQPPTPEVARFLGYDGMLREEGTLVLTRPPDVLLDPAGPLRGTVTRVTGLEDGMRVQIALEGGQVYAIAPLGGPGIGEVVGVSLRGGVRFAQTGERQASEGEAD
jgi:ABC-type cobalamin/Fe3+-siderophores transport system ATPase subunit